MKISLGATPEVAYAVISASGFLSSAGRLSARDDECGAPSLKVEEFPAVTVPSLQARRQAAQPFECGFGAYAFIAADGLGFGAGPGRDRQYLRIKEPAFPCRPSQYLTAFCKTILLRAANVMFSGDVLRGFAHGPVFEWTGQPVVLHAVDDFLIAEFPAATSAR